MNFHHSSGNLLPEDSHSFLKISNRAFEPSLRKRRTNKAALDGSTTESVTGSTSGSRKRGRQSITEQRAAKKAQMFGGAVDDEDPAIAEARFKRAKKEEEEDEEDFKEVGKIEMAVFERHPRPYGIGQDAEAVEDVKAEKKNINDPGVDLKTIDVNAIEDGPAVEPKREI